jgi:hypothetical protein
MTLNGNVEQEINKGENDGGKGKENRNVRETQA